MRASMRNYRRAHLFSVVEKNIATTRLHRKHSDFDSFDSNSSVQE